MLSLVRQKALESYALFIQTEWRQNVTQCSHLDAGTAGMVGKVSYPWSVILD